jgi:hypothetical protein
MIIVFSMSLDQKSFWPLCESYYQDFKIFGQRVIILTSLFWVLHSDTNMISRNKTNKKQDIPVIQPMQYRYHDGFILPPLPHDE